MKFLIELEELSDIVRLVHSLTSPDTPLDERHRDPSLLEGVEIAINDILGVGGEVPDPVREIMENELVMELIEVAVNRYIRRLIIRDKLRRLRLMDYNGKAMLHIQR